MALILQETHKHPKYPRLSLDLRADSRFYQARTYLDGKVRLKSTKATKSQLPTAFRVAEAWYKAQLKASVTEGRQHPLDKLTTDPTIAELFTNYRLTLAPHRRDYVDIKWGAIGDFWRTLTAADVTPKRVREFYTHRRRHKTQMKTVVTNNTLHKDVTLLRQILNYAIEEGHLDRLPTIPHPGAIVANPRPWLDRDEWDTLMGISDQRIRDAKANPRLRQQRQDLDDFLFFMVESMMRVSEVRNLTVGQCRVVKHKGQDAYLLSDVRGKTGHRTVVAGGDAPDIYTRRSKGLKPGDRLWEHGQRDAFRELLIAAKLRADSFGMSRNLKSIRATAISFAILKQAPTPNLLLIARNAGTSVVQLDTYYAKRLTAEMGIDQLNRSLAY